LTICSLFVAQNTGALEICGDIKQGELLLLKNAHDVVLYNDVNIDTFMVNPNELTDKVAYYKQSQDGLMPVALSRDMSQKVLLADYPGTDYGTVYELDVTAAKWDIQRVEGVASHHVAPDKSHEKEILREQNDVRVALAKTEDYAFWREGFILPIKGRISGDFGNQRIFNGVPKNPHSGTDIAAPEGTEVKASGRGRVVLSGKDYFYTGNMVIIDHGQGLHTIYAHLKEALVKEGDEVEQGAVIGYVGKTGRATGAHLHWGAVLNGVRFRPHSLLDINKKKCRHFDGVYIGSLVEE